jgi:hypothetical protein
MHGFMNVKMIFRPTSEKDEMVFARVAEYIYAEEMRVPVNANCDTAGLKISLYQRYDRYVMYDDGNFVFFRCLFVFW